MCHFVKKCGHLYRELHFPICALACYYMRPSSSRETSIYAIILSVSQLKCYTGVWSYFIDKSFIIKKLSKFSLTLWHFFCEYVIKVLYRNIQNRVWKLSKYDKHLLRDSFAYLDVIHWKSWSCMIINEAHMHIYWKLSWRLSSIYKVSQSLFHLVQQVDIYQKSPNQI